MPTTHQAFTDCLTAIEKLLPPDSLATLRPPASETSIQQVEQLLGSLLPLGLRQLLLWHDGQEWNAELRESDNRRLLAASEILDALKFFLDPEEEFCEPWERYWIPFLTNDSGDYVVVDASPSGTEELLYYWHDWDDRSVAYQSLSEWAEGLKEELSQ